VTVGGGSGKIKVVLMDTVLTVGGGGVDMIDL